MVVVFTGSFFMEREKLNGSARCFRYKPGCLARIPVL
jgi:hypothetical protein